MTDAFVVLTATASFFFLASVIDEFLADRSHSTKYGSHKEG
jgi:hypothetical protein